MPVPRTAAVFVPRICRVLREGRLLLHNYNFATVVNHDVNI